MPNISQIGIPGLSVQGILQPKQKNRWRVTFNGIGNGTDSQPLSVQAITITRPSISFDEVQLDRYTTRAWIGGKYTWDPMTIGIEDDVTGTATKVVQAQMQQQQQIIGAQGGLYFPAAPTGSTYKFSLTIAELDGNQEVIETWNVEGCWFSRVDWTDLDYATGEKVMINLTVRFDNAVQIINGYDGADGGADGQAIGGNAPST